MLSGQFGKLSIAEANFNEQAIKISHRQSEIFGKNYHNAVTGLERIKIVYKVPDYQNVSVDNDLLSFKCDINLVGSQICFEELDSIIKNSLACANRCKTNDYTESVIMPVYQKEQEPQWPGQQMNAPQNQPMNAPPMQPPYGQVNNPTYGQMNNSPYGIPQYGQQMPVQNNYYQPQQQGYRNSWGGQGGY